MDRLHTHTTEEEKDREREGGREREKVGSAWKALEAGTSINDVCVS